MIKSIMYMMALLPIVCITIIVWKVYYLVTFFLNKMIVIRMRTSIGWSMMWVMKNPLCLTKILMRILRHSWKIQSMTCPRRKIMNHNLLKVLLISPFMTYLMEGVLILLMVLLKILSMRFLEKRAWILSSWEIFVWRKSTQFVHMISLSHILV